MFLPLLGKKKRFNVIGKKCSQSAACSNMQCVLGTVEVRGEYGMVWKLIYAFLVHGWWTLPRGHYKVSVIESIFTHVVSSETT